jgi:nicotinamide mononucleotide transporter
MHIIQFLQEWWSHQTWSEIIAVITGLLCVYLAAVNNIWNWPFAIISVGIYIFIFFEARLYADMGLQFYFISMNIYGWYNWSRSQGTKRKTPVLMISRHETILSLLAIVVFTVLLGSVLKYTTASFPYLDSFCTACSLVAQLFLARKILQNWLIWIFVDIIYIGVYTYKNLHLTAIMYAAYAAMAILGYLDWKKEYKRQIS